MPNNADSKWLAASREGCLSSAMSEPNPRVEIGPSPQAAGGLLEAAHHPSSDLGDEQIKRFFYCGTAETPSTLVGLDIYDGAALLSSLVVSPDARSLGLLMHLPYK